jgi:hypothetical protein
MTKWLSGLRGAVFTLVLWVVGWALGFGGLAEMFVDPDGETLDVWPAEMAIPGFRFDEVPLVRFTIWGGVTGLTLGVVSITTDGPIPLSLTSAEMLSLATALCVVAAIGTSVFFRLLVRRPVLTMARRPH